jgi:hypothetical protein
MNPEDVLKLKHGLYRVFWKPENGGGSSLAAIGSNFNGKRWIAPTNWIRVNDTHDSWHLVDRVELIEAGK